MAFLKITRRIKTSVILALLGVFVYFSYTRPVYRTFLFYTILGSNSPPIETILGLFNTVNWLTVIFIGFLDFNNRIIVYNTSSSNILENRN